MREQLTIPFDDTHTLVGYRWSNPDVTPVGIVQIAHGLSEHVTRYEKFANFLVENNYIVVAFDHYMHGESCENIENIGVITDIDFIEAVMKSTKLVYDAYVTPTPLKKILFAHSMGSIMSQAYIQYYPNDFETVILSGTDVGDFKYALLNLLTSLTIRKKNPKKSSKLVHNLTFGGFQKKFSEPSPFNWLSKNQENVQAYEKDPLCGAAVPDVTYKSIAKSLRKSYQFKNIKKIKPDLKIFIFSGAEDPVSGLGKSVKKLTHKYQKASLLVTSKLYPTLRHETLNEVECELVCADILKFIRS